MRESDLYVPVRDWLKEKGYNPKGEVCGTDILALRGDTLLSVELKSSLNLEVILQAVDRQRFSDLVYIAVPKNGKLLFTRRWKMLAHLLRRLELGLLLVSLKPEQGFVEEAISPVPFDRSQSRARSKNKRMRAVEEYEKRHGDQNTGGVNKAKIMTAYRENALLIAYLLDLHGPMSPKRLRELGTDRGKTTATLRNNFYGWFEHHARGVYSLNEQGKQALDTHKSFVEALRKTGGLE